MEVRKDFGKRVTALSEGVPRNVVAMLLKKLLPPEPVSVRRPEGGWKLDRAPAAVDGEYVDKETYLKRRIRAYKGRRGAVKSAQYKVTYDYAANNHRWGTWTRAMVDSVINAAKLSDGEWTTSSEAQTYLVQNYPKYADRHIDWNWLAKDVCYIELKE